MVYYSWDRHVFFFLLNKNGAVATLRRGKCSRSTSACASMQPYSESASCSQLYWRSDSSLPDMSTQAWVKRSRRVAVFSIIHQPPWRFLKKRLCTSAVTRTRFAVRAQQGSKSPRFRLQISIWYFDTSLVQTEPPEWRRVQPAICWNEAITQEISLKWQPVHRRWLHPFVWSRHPVKICYY